ncbi:MAG: hypothetical protein CR981_04210 [Proteobacteria bacterium]|nr:MAG: hypothetical protein CR981_04210 [Pseudomonadota bacterium]
MIIRVLLAAFSSLVGGFCYLAGLTRLMSGLLIGFGLLTSLFFAVLLIVTPNSDASGFPVYGSNSPLPFFLLALVLLLMIIWLFLARPKPAKQEALSSVHFKYLAAGLLAYLSALFLPAFLWFPSAEKLLSIQTIQLEREVLAGVCLYLAGSSGALFLLFLSTKGGTPYNPDLMRRLVPALMALLHFDKMPALLAYLLIYSPETPVVFPRIAALALAGYIPFTLFLVKISVSFRNQQSS